MDNPPDIKLGDRVRVVLEGEVVREWLGGPGGFLVGAGAENLIIGSDKHVVSIEVLAKPAKVGDRFKPVQQQKRMAALPNRTVVTASGGSETYVKVGGNWFWLDNDGGAPAPYPAESMYAERTIVYLPE